MYFHPSMQRQTHFRGHMASDAKSLGQKRRNFRHDRALYHYFSVSLKEEILPLYYFRSCLSYSAALLL